MKLCLKCNNTIPLRKKIDGKFRNFQHRKYCLDCSPFGSHNTKQIQDITTKELSDCKFCGRKLKNRRRRACESCSTNRKRDKLSTAVYEFLGNKCWYCIESIGEQSRYILCLHHVYPKDKKYGLNASIMAGIKKTELKEELKKCVCLCHNCHSKFHYTDLITQEEIEKLYSNFWDSITEIDI